MSSVNVGDVISQTVRVSSAILREKVIYRTAEHHPGNEEAGELFRGREIDWGQIKTASHLIHQMRGWIPAPGGGKKRGMIAIGHLGNDRVIVLRVGTIQSVAVPQ